MVDKEDEENKEKKQPPPKFFLFKNCSPAIYLKGVKKFETGEVFNGVQTIYTITLYHFDMDDTVVEYLDEEVRNSDYKTFIEYLEENGYEFLNKTF
jgi:hypothetical protein